ncbi:MAG TPA: helix-turn-helix domain-containing protein [Frankiaceae bacterium]|nr:helix-turn-helix domain-containing protein [Frankiaceae bacterium]
MTGAGESETVGGAGGLALAADVVSVLRARLPAVAERTVAAVTAEVPEYAGALTGRMGANIEQAVQTALGAFLRLAEQARGSDPSTPLQPAMEGAYALGRGEARSGRSMDALLAAYRVGARVSWRELAATAVEGGLSASTLAQFAELVFAYIDQLSAASVAGHTDELETTGRVRLRYLEKLAEDLLSDVSPEVLLASAERAGWTPPDSLTAVLVPSARARTELGLLDPRTLTVTGDATGGGTDGMTVLLVPDAARSDRNHLLRMLQGRAAVVGPGRPWTEVNSSYRRALRGLALLGDDRLVDTDEHLSALVLSADPDALADLRTRALAPLSGLRPATAERLSETLRSWLLHHGRREDVAEELVVHPQTVRYRMTQLRGLFGDRLNDPDSVLELTLALARPDGLRCAAPPTG